MNEFSIERREGDAVLFDGLVAAGVPHVLAALYAARGIADVAELDTHLKSLPSPSTLKGIDTAAARLARAIQTNERICIIADYDADGATACAVGLRGLRMLGANVDYLVPNRFEFGYGLTPEIVSLAHAEKSPQLIMTVDNGIASIDGVDAARALGIDVLITDHHLPGATLPDALIVNPNQSGCTFESKALAGVGVMFYVLLALRAVLEAKEVNLAQLLDLVAVGTVADVVPLDRVNRILVDQGLRRMRAGRISPGLAAMLHVAGKETARLTAQDLGFILGPRINAAGRLADISLGIECMITDDATRAQEIAYELDTLNRERRDIEGGMRDEALRAIASVPVDERFTICLVDNTWHQGVIGIVAGRIKDAVHRPTIVFAPGATDDELKGSGRSIPGFHIRDALDWVSKQAPHLIRKFGGHAMAAGLTIVREGYDEFAEWFEQAARTMIPPHALEKKILTDGPFFAPQVSIELIETLDARVWGQAFPAPLFDEELRVVDARVVAGKHTRLRVRRGTDVLTALVWNTVEPFPPRIHAVYRPVINRFQGVERAELIIDVWSPLPS